MKEKVLIIIAIIILVVIITMFSINNTVSIKPNKINNYNAGAVTPGYTAINVQYLNDDNIYDDEYYNNDNDYNSEFTGDEDSEYVVLMNPGKGFTSMFESVDDDCMPLIDTMYYRFDWVEIAPDDPDTKAEGEDKYNWRLIDFLIRRAVERNKKIAFGVMNASTSSTSKYVTPKWVFDKGAESMTVVNGGREQIIPVWDDPIFLEEMHKFIAAMGERYNGNENITFIDMLGFGNWGEQHYYGFFDDPNSTYADDWDAYMSAEKLKELYIIPYMESFPDTYVVNPWGVPNYNEVYMWAIDNGVGLRRCGIMGPKNSYTYNGYVMGQEMFLYADGKLPCMFEYEEYFRNQIDNLENYKKLDMKYLWEYILDWKPTYIEMLPALYKKEEYWCKRIANKVGYYFKYTGGEYESNITDGENKQITIDFLNDGVQRLFEPCTVYAGILDENDNVVKKVKTNINAQQWLSGQEKEENISISYSGVENGNYKLAIGLFYNEEDENPTYLIANKGKTENNWYVIGNVTVNMNGGATIIGDVDGDNTVNAYDAYLALKYSLESNLTEEQTLVADIDKSGDVTAYDAYLILKKSVGME